MAKRNLLRFAGIEYSGIAGCTSDCIKAVVRRLHHGDCIVQVLLLSCKGSHCLLLKDDIGDLVAVKSGFSSGYAGEGPRGLGHVLNLLELHGAEIEEIDVAEEIVERINASCLTTTDLDFLDKARPIRPQRWHEYIYDDKRFERDQSLLWKQHFPPVVPLAIVDGRIADLALAFPGDPDGALLSAYRRLEDVVRHRTELLETGVKLFSIAFQGQKSRLWWPSLHEGEQAGRASLFIGTYMAYRNPRAHKEQKLDRTAQVAEFMLLNHLYMLEEEAQTRPVSDTDLIVNDAGPGNRDNKTAKIESS